MTRPRLSLLATALALPFGIGAAVFTPSVSADHHASDAAVATGSIVDVLAADEQFSTLVGLLESTGLDATLREEGPFTLFAPNNAAFEKADPEKIEAILKGKKRLKRVLMNHVVSGKMTAADLQSAGEVESISERPLKVKTRGSKLFVSNRRVMTADIEAENGIVHAMHEGFLPRPKKDGADAGKGKNAGGGGGGIEAPE